MSESEVALILMVAGVIVVLIGSGLACVRINPRELSKKSHTSPGLALFRFSAYRWGGVIVCLIVGVIMIVSGWSTLASA